MRRVWGITAFGLLAAALAPVAHGETCSVGSYGAIPIELVGERALTTIKLDGQDGRFVVDTGAFYSSMPRAMATGLRLPIQPGPWGLRVGGVGGEMRVEMATAGEVQLLNSTIPKVDFLVGGSDTGAGLLGANLLMIGDLDTDLSNGLLRMLKVTGCHEKSMAYWVTDQNWQEAPLLPKRSEYDRLARVTVLINGRRVEAMLDTGASSTVISRDAARRVGIALDGPGVTDGGISSGIGRASYRSWIVPVDSFQVGSELIQHSRMRVIDGSFGMGAAPDMLLGIDFFLAHHLLISFSHRRIYFTYNGGRMFTGSAAPKSAAKPSTATDSGGKGPALDAAALAVRGEAHLAKGEVEPALADLDAAVAGNPDEPRYRKARARARLAAHRGPEAIADLDAALAKAPGDLDALMMRAALRVRSGNRAGSLADLNAARGLVRPGSNEGLVLATAMVDNDQPEAALPLLDEWIRLHADDVALVRGLNARCWARALANREIEGALADCQRALRSQPANPSYLDSLGMVQVRRGHWAEAIKAYRAALAGVTKSAWTHYGLGLALAGSGDAKAAEAEFTIAAGFQPDLAERAARMGLARPAPPMPPAPPAH